MVHSKNIVVSLLAGLIELAVYVYCLYGRVWYIWVLVFIAMWIANIMSMHVNNETRKLNKLNRKQIEDLEKRLNRLGLLKGKNE